MYMVMWSPSHDLSHDSVDLAATNHPKMQPAPIKEDAITETLTSDGRLRFGNTRVPPGDFGTSSQRIRARCGAEGLSGSERTR